MRDVHMMPHPIHQRTSARVVVPAPGLVYASRCVGHPRRRSEPSLPIQSLGRRTRLHQVAEPIPIGKPRGDTNNPQNPGNVGASRPPPPRFINMPPIDIETPPPLPPRPTNEHLQGGEPHPPPPDDAERTPCDGQTAAAQPRRCARAQKHP